MYDQNADTSFVIFQFFLASGVNPEVPYELFFTLSGNLRNGKTLMDDLIMATFGAKEYVGEECRCAYASDFSTDFLCKDRKDSDPSPELLEFRHSRVIDHESNMPPFEIKWPNIL